jgi:hypothetical protein
MPIGKFAAYNGVVWLSVPAVTCLVSANRAWQPYFPAEPAYLPARMYAQHVPILSVSQIPAYTLEDLLDWYWPYRGMPGGFPLVAVNGLVRSGPPVFFIWPGDHMLRLNYPRLTRLVYTLEGVRHEVSLTFMGGTTDVPNSLPNAQTTNYALDIVPQVIPPIQTVFSATERGAFLPTAFAFRVNGIALPVSRLMLSIDLQANPSYAGGINPRASAPMPVSGWKFAEEEPAWYWVGQPTIDISAQVIHPDPAENLIAKHHIVPNVEVYIPTNRNAGATRGLLLRFPYMRSEVGLMRYLGRGVTEYSVYLRGVAASFTIGIA